MPLKKNNITYRLLFLYVQTKHVVGVCSSVVLFEEVPHGSIGPLILFFVHIYAIVSDIISPMRLLPMMPS